MTNSDLAARARSIMALEDQRTDIADDITERYADAKNAGFTVAALKRAIKIARMDGDKRARHEAEQMDIELYLAEIEGRSLREAAE